MIDLKKYVTFAAITLTAMAFLCSCVKEDMSDCPSDEYFVSIGFDNVQPNYKDEVGRMDIFIFDAHEILYSVLSESGITLTDDYAIRTQLPAGDYRLVGWSDHGCHYKAMPETVIVGVTTLSQATAMLDVAEDGIVDNDLHTSLFGTTHVSVGDPQVRSVESLIKIPLQQNTYRINLTAEGVDDAHNYTITIADDNGSYYFDNTFAPGLVLQYTSGQILPAQEKLDTSLTTLRLARNRSPLLTITDNTAQTVILSKDLVAMILASEQSSGIPIDFSTQHEFDIHINFDRTTLSTTITVNGWEVSLGDDEELG